MLFLQKAGKGRDKARAQKFGVFTNWRTGSGIADLRTKVEMEDKMFGDGKKHRSFPTERSRRMGKEKEDEVIVD